MKILTPMSLLMGLIHRPDKQSREVNYFLCNISLLVLVSACKKIPEDSHTQAAFRAYLFLGMGLIHRPHTESREVNFLPLAEITQTQKQRVRPLHFLTYNAQTQTNRNQSHLTRLNITLNNIFKMSSLKCSINVSCLSQ